MRRRWVGYAVAFGMIGAGVAAVVVIARMPAQNAPPPPVAVPPVNVRIMTVQPAPQLADDFTLTAVVEPEQVVRVAAEVAGRIERYGARTSAVEWLGRKFEAGSPIAEGEPVSAGDPIVLLNKDMPQARFDRSSAQFEFDEREYRRILGLFESGATSKTELEDARTKRDVSRGMLDEATRELERTTIYAPRSGVLNRLPMEPGEYAVPGETVAEIVKVDVVKVVVSIPERDVHYLHVGDTARILAGPNAGELDGTITYISALAHTDSRTSRLEITIDNRDYRLRSGQIVRARLTRRLLSDVVMVPLAAVIPLESGKLVFLDVDGQAQPREVELGFIKGRDVQVVRGLAAGERVIIDGHRYVGPGQRIHVIDTP